MPYRRGIYITEDSLDNWSMAKCHTKPNKNRWKHEPFRKGFPIVTADEVMEKLLEMGVKRDKRTLRRYAKEGLILKPETKSLGRGKGKMTDYPDFSPSEFYASWSMISGYGITYEQMKQIRDLAIEVIMTRMTAIKLFQKEFPDFNENPERKKTYEYLKKTNDFFYHGADQRFSEHPKLFKHFGDPDTLAEYATIWNYLLKDKDAAGTVDKLFNELDESVYDEIFEDEIKSNMEDIEQSLAKAEALDKNHKDFN